MTFISDAHCDSILLAYDKGFDLFSDKTKAHITVPGLQRNKSILQIFACFTSDTEGCDNIRKRSNDLINEVLTFSQGPGLYRPRTKEELLDSPNRDRVAILPAIEGGEALGDTAKTIAQVKQQGIVYITLAWGDNSLTGSAFGENRGLSGIGLEIMSEMNSHSILVDVSHMSDAAFEDVVKYSNRMFIASHSNCRSLCNIKRNLTDDQIREIASRGGVIGINFSAAFLNEEVRKFQLPYGEKINQAMATGDPDAWKLYDEINKELEITSPRATLDDIVDHMEHIIDLVGYKHVALGSDFDGFRIGVEEFDNCDGYQMIIDRMKQRGFSHKQIEAIAWENWLRIFATTFES
jgi:membrane dipeptidase